jgi:predicted lipoprotein with Yx(FWY)xxD motif
MRLIMKLIPVLAVSSLVAACGSSSSTSTPSASASQPSSASSTALVKTASVPSLGAPVLVDAQGLTLYHLSGEQNGKWICTSSACVKVWHPLAAPASGAPTGSVGSLGTVKRPNGATQVTFKGWGIEDVGVWSALTANGSDASTAPAPTTTSSSSSSSSSSGGGYGY